MNDLEMTSDHVRAARMLLRWEQKILAKRSGVSLPTIKRLESKPGPLGAYASTLAAIRAAFEDEGIEFFNAEAPGVRLHRRPKRLREHEIGGSYPVYRLSIALVCGSGRLPTIGTATSLRTHWVSLSKVLNTSRRRSSCCCRRHDRRYPPPRSCCWR